MKCKNLILFLLFVFFLYPVTVFSGEWTWMNPLPQGNSLAGVWGSSGSDVFAVGYATILHYDGSTWSAMEHGAIEYLDDVWGS